MGDVGYVTEGDKVPEGALTDQWSYFDETSEIRIQNHVFAICKEYGGSYKLNSIFTSLTKLSDSCTVKQPLAVEVRKPTSCQYS